MSAKRTNRLLPLLNPKMDELTRDIFYNAFRSLAGKARWYVDLAREARSKPQVYAAQMRRAREHALEARDYHQALRAAGFSFRRGTLLLADCPPATANSFQP